MNGTMILDLKQTRVMEVPIERITRSAITLRPLDEQVIFDLMMSIKSCGLLQPIMLTPRGEQFEVIFGNHRLEACKRLCWKEISAVIGKVSSEEAFILQVVENIQRNNVINPVEEAKGYKLLIEKGLTINEISGKIGKSYQYVWSRIKLIQNLHPLILEGLANRKFRKLSLSHAEQLSLIKNPRRQLELANVIEDHNISLEELEAVVYTDMFPPAQNEEQKRQLPRLRKSGSSFFIEKDRICLLTEETFNIVINHLGRKARAIGRKAGKSRRKRILVKPDRTIPKEKWLVSCLNDAAGLGKLSINNSSVTLASPMVTNRKFMQGYLEGLLNLELAVIGTPSKSMIFRIEAPIITGLLSPHGEI